MVKEGNIREVRAKRPHLRDIKAFPSNRNLNCLQVSPHGTQQIVQPIRHFFAESAGEVPCSALQKRFRVFCQKSIHAVALVWCPEGGRSIDCGVRGRRGGAKHDIYIFEDEATAWILETAELQARQRLSRKIHRFGENGEWVLRFRSLTPSRVGLVLSSKCGPV